MAQQGRTLLELLGRSGSKTLIIMRGLPGAGKSTLVDELQDDIKKSAAVCSADNFFIEDGVYRFDQKRLGEAHLTCYKTALQTAQTSTDVIVIDNTNVTRAEYTPYVMLGRAFDYDVFMVHVITSVEMGTSRNVHGVPRSTIERMAARWEPPSLNDPLSYTIRDGVVTAPIEEREKGKRV